MDDKIKKLFIGEYEKFGAKLEKENAERLTFSFGGKNHIVDEQDIREYAEDFVHFSAFSPGLNDCSVATPGSVESRVREASSRLIIGPLAESIVIGEENGSLPVIRIGLASRRFLNYFRFHPWVLERMFAPYFRGEVILRTRLPKWRTITVDRLAKRTVQEAVESASTLICGALFQVAALDDRAFVIADTFPRLRSSLEELDEDAVKRHDLPKAKFRPELVSFYTLGVASEVPELQFLAFYQILEFFYLSVSDQILYDKLARRVVAFDFEPRPPSLDRVIQDVLQHRRETDETAMLRMVLDKYVEKSDLMDWIVKRENFLSKKPYTSKTRAFGSDLQIATQEDHLLHTTSKFIKTIRNAIVHSSDRHERSERHIPFSKTTNVIKDAVPLVRYLAEKVVFASST